MRTNTFRLLCAAAIGVLPAIAVGSPALAGGATSDVEQRAAYVQWLGEGDVPGVLAGNVHRGVVSASDDLATTGVDAASGRVEAWTCPAGVTPPELFQVDDPEAPSTTCTFEGARDLRLDSAALEVRDGLVGARLTGSAAVTDPAGGSAATTVGIDLTFAAAGPLVSDTFSQHWVDETGRHTSRTAVAQRDAAAVGTVGTVSVGAAAWQLADLHSQVDRVR